MGKSILQHLFAQLSSSLLFLCLRRIKATQSHPPHYLHTLILPQRPKQFAIISDELSGSQAADAASIPGSPESHKASCSVPTVAAAARPPSRLIAIPNSSNSNKMTESHSAHLWAKSRWLYNLKKKKKKSQFNLLYWTGGVKVTWMTLVESANCSLEQLFS